MIKIKKKSLVLPVISTIFLAVTVATALFSRQENEEVLAATDTTTDMSEVALLSGESIDTANIIYDDFSGVSLNGNWVVSHRKWGGYDNKGVSSKNVYLDTKNDKVIIKALGNQHVGTSTIDGVGGPVSGGALVLKQTARPGRYETRLKAAYKVGVCNAFWTYTNNKGENHEIDIEFPVKDNQGNNSFDEVIFTNYIGETNFQQTHEKLNYYLNDGEYHTYAFDWYYSASHKVIKYYIDSHLLATHQISSKLPFLPSRLWLGCWIPNNPGFVGLPNFDECFMEIDYFKYSPFANQESVTQGNAGGCGNTSLDYNVIDGGFDRYDWLSNGSFHSINKTDSLADRGNEVTGTTLLYNAFDHAGASNSGGLKMSPSSSISYKVDSTYPGFKYEFSTYYKGNGKVTISFYNKGNGYLNNVSLVLPNRDSWGPISYPFEIPANTFYTVVKVETTSNDLYLDDMFTVLSQGEEPIEEVVLLSISLTGPNKTTYQIGESLDLTGLMVIGTYSDGSTKTITDYQVSQVDLSTSGTKTVTITKDDQSATFTIIVDEEGHSSATLISIAIEGEFKKEYYVGEELDFSGMVVKASFSDGSSKEITNYQIYKPDTKTAGIKRVTIIYIDQTATFNITVREKPAEQPEDTGLGCGGSLIASSALLSITASFGLITLLIKKKKQ